MNLTLIDFDLLVNFYYYISVEIMRELNININDESHESGGVELFILLFVNLFFLSFFFLLF